MQVYGLVDVIFSTFCYATALFYYGLNKNISSIYTEYPRKFCNFIFKIKLYKVTELFKSFAMRLQIELRCILFPLIILEILLKLGVHLW